MNTNQPLKSDRLCTNNEERENLNEYRDVFPRRCAKKTEKHSYVIYEKGKRKAIKNPLLHSSKKKAQNDDVINKNCLFQVGKKCLASYFGFTVRTIACATNEVHF